MNELISIIVPIYNVEKYLHKCINSILNQTYKNLEIILVDDGSTDKSGAICDEYENQDSRIKVIHKTNGGLSDARNAGIEVARGEFFSFIDSDDYISENMIECLYKRIIADGTDMSLCNCWRVDEEGNVSNQREDELICDSVIKKQDIFNVFVSGFGTIFTIAWAKLYKRKLFDDIRYPIGKIHEDEFVAHRMLGKCNSISYTNKRLYYYLQRKESISNFKFTIKKLDKIEALLDRTKYALDNNVDMMAEKSFKETVGYFVFAYKNLDMNDKQVKLRMNELKQCFDKLYPKTKKVIKSLTWKHLILLFKINPCLYVKLYYFKKRYFNE